MNLRILLMLLLLMGTFGVMRSQDVDAKAAKCHLKAMQAMRKGEQMQALRLLDKALVLSPHFMDARRLRSSIYMDQRNWMPGLADLDTLLMVLPYDVESRMRRAEICLLSGRPLLGIQDMETLLSQPDMEMGMRSEAMQMKARLLKEGGHTKDALQTLNASLKMNPGWGEGHLLRAELMEQIRDFDNALSDFNLAISLSSPKGRAYYGRALFFLHRKDEGAACQDMEQALRNDFVPSPKEQAEWESLRKACNMLQQKSR